MKCLPAFLCLFVAASMQGSHGRVYQGSVLLAQRQPRTPFVAPHTTQKLASQAMELNSKERGVRDSNLPIIPRIVGGTEAKKHEFPWLASLRYRGHHYCGASVIDEWWLITAAHCYVIGCTVIAGEHQLSQHEAGEQHREVETIIRHPQYNPKLIKNDIALVKLAKPLKLDGKTVSPISLPSPLVTSTGNCTVAGWGVLDTDKGLSDILMKLEVPIITDEECEKIFDSIEEAPPIQDSMICAGHTSGGKGACWGDSGSALVCPGKNNQNYMAGVVSWGNPCAQPNFVDVYTEVSYFVDWINNVMGSYVTLPSRPNTAGEGQ